MIRHFVVGLMFLAVGSSVFAYRMGNPGKLSEKGKGDIGAVLELGQRDLDVDGADSSDMDITGLTVEGRYGIGTGLELRGRLIPMTTKWDADDGVEPNMLGLGAGLQWSPDGQKGPLTWGLGAGLDWGQGDDGDVDVDYMDITLNGGVNYAVNKTLDAYGGLSFTNSDVMCEGQGWSVDADMDNPLVLFGGVDCKTAKNWILAAEIRRISETIISLNGRYAFKANIPA